MGFRLARIITEPNTHVGIYSYTATIEGVNVVYEITINEDGTGKSTAVSNNSTDKWCNFEYTISSYIINGNAISIVYSNTATASGTLSSNFTKLNISGLGVFSRVASSSYNGHNAVNGGQDDDDDNGGDPIILGGTPHNPLPID